VSGALDSYRAFHLKMEADYKEHVILYCFSIESHKSLFVVDGKAFIQDGHVFSKI